MTKNISIICHNYFPEETSTGLYTTLMAEFLSKNGWEVTMVTGFPHYPQWEIDKNYKDKSRFFREQIKGVKVLRYKHYVPGQPSFRNRIGQLLDFTLGSYFNLLKVEKPDVIMSIIPFTSSAWLGAKFSKKYKCKHWIHIQDFEFDAATESGMLASDGIGANLMRRLYKTERKILDSADLVSTISQGMLTKLKGRTESDTFFFPNWLDESAIDPKSATRHQVFENGKFNVLYSGNIGNKQDWELFIAIANKLEYCDTVQFIVIGDGASRHLLEKETRQLGNVQIYDPVPMHELNDLLCTADLHILFQKDNVIDTVMPSKLLGMMASTVPCLVTGSPDSEIAQIFTNSKAGYYLPAKEVDRVSEKIKTLSKERSLKPEDNLQPEMGKKARGFILDSFSKEQVMNRFLIKLNSLK